MATPFEKIFNEQYVPNDRKKSVGIYKLLSFIGKGAFSTVREGVNTETGQKIAVKILPKSSSVPKATQTRHLMCSEIRVLQKLRHPNIISMIDWMETDRNVYIVLELVQGINAKDLLQSVGSMKESTAQVYFHQIVSAVAYMHSKGIIHRDLKPSNFLLDKGSPNRIVLIDFGLSVHQDEMQELLNKCGSPVFIAPEILSGERFTPAADVWSLGVTLYLFVTGNLPFACNKGQSTAQLLFSILRGYNSSLSLTEDCQELISRILKTDPTQRIQSIDILSHPWLTEIPDVTIK